MERVSMPSSGLSPDSGMWEREYRIEHGRVEHLTEQVCELQKRLAPEPEWRSMDSAPQDGTEILLSCPNGGKIECGTHIALAAWHPTEAGWYRDTQDDYSATWPPIAWMPPPAPATRPVPTKEGG